MLYHTKEPAPAKLNLYLQVTDRRPDGYHLLESLVAFAELDEEVEARPSGELTVTVKGPFASSVPPEENSVLKAARALRQAAGIKAGAALTLRKHLPVAAGLGGGSADAAATLRLLSRFWDVRLPEEELAALALSLGADVPACLRSQSLYMSGIGERIAPGPDLKGLHAVLANPGTSLPTPQVFSAFGGAYSTPLARQRGFSTASDAVEFLKNAGNDLEEAAIGWVPEIRWMLEALAAQEHCLLARMSGSGASCFGLFGGADEAQAAAARLKTGHSGWWLTAAALR